MIVKEIQKSFYSKMRSMHNGQLYGYKRILNRRPFFNKVYFTILTFIFIKFYNIYFRLHWIFPRRKSCISLI